MPTKPFASADANVAMSGNCRAGNQALYTPIDKNVGVCYTTLQGKCLLLEQTAS